MRLLAKRQKARWFGLSWLLSGLILILLWPQVAAANGGTIIVNGDKGPFNVSLLASPTPPSPEVPVHLTLILTKAGSDTQIKDATIIAKPTMPGMAMPGADEPKRFIQTTSRPNQYDVDVPVSMEGLWSLNVQIISPQFGQTSFDVNLKVEKPSAPWGVIVGILVAMPLLAGLTWWLLFRKSGEDEEEEEEEEKALT
jgi:hypothetical protein